MTTEIALEDLTTPFDDSDWENDEKALAAITADGLASFSGAAVAATVETDEVEPGRRALARTRVMNARPICDGGAPSVAIGVRDCPTDTVTQGAAVAMTSRGDCWQRAEGRLVRARLTLPAGADFQHLDGVELDIQRGGRR